MIGVEIPASIGEAAESDADFYGEAAAGSSR
jgi:hypothetical protein